MCSDAGQGAPAAAPPAPDPVHDGAGRGRNDQCSLTGSTGERGSGEIEPERREAHRAQARPREARPHISPLDKLSVAILTDPAAVFRFDGSDLMPSSVGAGSFWTEMTNWVTGQDDATTLANIEKSWPTS